MRIFWILCLMPFLAPAQDTEWRRITLPDHGCSLLFPDIVQEKSTVINTSIGELEVLTAFTDPAEESHPNEMYLINTTIYPEDFITHDSTDLILALMQDVVAELSESLYGEIDYHSDLLVTDLIQSKFRISYNERQAVCKGVIIYSNNRLHVLEVFNKVTKSLNDEKDVFLESFLASTLEKQE